MDTALLITAYPQLFRRRLVLGLVCVMAAMVSACVSLASVAGIFFVGLSMAVLLCVVIVLAATTAVSAFRLGRQHLTPATCSPLLRDLHILLPHLHAHSPDDISGEPSEPLDELVGAYKIMDRAMHRERAQQVAAQILTYLHRAGVDLSRAKPTTSDATP
jgi:hypothetical protein